MADEMLVDGRPVPVEPGQTVAGALMAAGVRAWRTTRRAGRPRGIFCGIGACYDCLIGIDGRAGQRACLAPARPGSVVTTDADPVTTPPQTTVDAEVHAPRQRCDIAVVGAGPAGLAAAATAALSGARVALIDAGERAGGQFWRHREGRTGRDWRRFEGLMSIVEERVDYLPATTVRLVEPGFVLHTGAGRVEARQLVLATGAYDRALPFPGWDLPGVVTPGAAQAMLKGSGVLVGRRVVVAGAGPFLLPVAVGLADAGARVIGVYEAGDPRAYLRHPRALAGAAGKVTEAAGYAAALARYRIPYRTRQAVVAARGTTAVTGVDVARLDAHGRMEPGSVRPIGADAVAVGYGFTANLDLALALGCAIGFGADGGLAVQTGADTHTSVGGVYAAGEVTGVGGAALAVVEGELAGAAAARAGGAPSPLSARELAGLRRRRQRLRAFAASMHAVHGPGEGWLDWLEDATLVCRCEEVTRADVAAAVRLGATDARSVKALARPGMGWCQGRVCGHATAALTARLCDRPLSMEDLVTFAARPFAAPLTLGELSHLGG